MKQEPVVIIGAGLAGLCCARRLVQDGVPVLVLEAQDGVGGRVMTDIVDGFRLDRGFQVMQTAYSEATAQLDYAALNLRRFEPGAMIRTEGRFVTMSDPWRRPGRLLSTALNGIGTFSDRLKLAKLRWHVTHSTDAELWSEPESTTRDYLRTTCGLSEDMISRFFRPWFAGVFLENELTTSSRFFRFLFRTFALGDASLPENGMSAIPEQLASSLPPATLRLSTRVDFVEGRQVRLTGGELINSRCVVLAVEGPEASRLTAGQIRTPEARSTCCFYFSALRPPFTEPLLVLNGDGNGPVNNLSVVSNVAKTYAPGGRSLISVSVVEPERFSEENLESDVRRQLNEWYGPQVNDWSLLRRYDIPFALPSQPAHFRDDGPASAEAVPGVYRCGDYCETASIQGAMISGRHVAEAILSCRNRDR